MMKNIIIGLSVSILLLGFSGCKTATGPHPVETGTYAGESLQMVEPIADLEKANLPVGVDRSDLVAVVRVPLSDGQVAEATIVQTKTGLLSKPKLSVYLNKTAAKPAPVENEKSGIKNSGTPEAASVHTMKPDHTLCMVGLGGGLLGLAALILFAVMRGFVSRSPRTWIKGIVALVKWLIKSFKN